MLTYSSINYCLTHAWCVQDKHSPMEWRSLWKTVNRKNQRCLSGLSGYSNWFRYYIEILTSIPSVSEHGNIYFKLVFFVILKLVAFIARSSTCQWRSRWKVITKILTISCWKTTKYPSSIKWHYWTIARVGSKHCFRRGR